MKIADRFFSRLLLAGLLGWLTLAGQAQEADYTTWAKMGVEYGVCERLDVSAGLEWRTKDNLGMTDH